MSLQPIIKSISEKYDISKIPTDILDKIIDEEIEAVSSILKENLGILRRDMPQVDSNNLKNAIDLVKRSAGVKHEMVSVGILKKTQKNMIPAKVAAIANKTTNPTKIKPVIISSDNHIVDGHHRWAAVLQKYGQDQKIPVYRIDKPIKDALHIYTSVASALNEMLNEYGALLHYVSLTPVEFKKFSQNYKKIHSDNKVGVDKKENMYYGYRKGSKYFHWKYDADKYELHFEHSKYQQQVLGLLNWFDKYKDSHIWGESFIVENKKSDEIWKRFKPQITALIDNIQNQFGIHPSITAVLLTTIINKNFSSKYKMPSTWEVSNVGKDLPEAAAPNHLVEGMYDPVNIRKYYEALCKAEGVTPLPVKFETVGKGGASLTYNPKTMKPLYISFDVKRLSDPEFAIIHELTHQIKLETESDAYVGKRDQSAKFKKLENRLIDKYVYSNYSKLLYEFLNEIPMGDLVQIDKYADKQLDPVDVVLTDKHFFDRLTDPRNEKDISQAELIRFFKQLSKRKNEFLEVLEKYKEIVVTDDKTNINIPFIKQANKAIAKTIMRKPGFKTPSPHLKFENKI